MKTRTLSISLVSLALTAVVQLNGCSAESPPPTVIGTGGTATTGGAAATSGGSTGTSGGQPATTTGGSVGAGTGGASVATGGTATGGSSGGTSSTSGGSLATGGTAQGGASGGNPTATGGSAGSPGATGGMAGGGAAGSAGAAGMSSGGGGGGAVRSTGCGVARTEAQGSFVQFTLDVAGTTREYFVYLPKSYDAMRAYPVVYQFHGAGGTGKSNNVPIEKSSGSDAIVVGGTALVNTSENRTQWQFTSASSPDLAFFDALVTKINESYCVDTTRLFATGFSSGSWMNNLLGCLRPKVLRAYGNVSGGMAINTNSCSKTDGIAARFIHDSDDTENVIAGSQKARDRLLTVNGCTMTTAPDTPSPCVRYQGCRAGLPVDWCQTSGKGHNVQATLSGPAFWTFFSSF